jgi:hypothetical protein
VIFAGIASAFDISGALLRSASPPSLSYIDIGNESTLAVDPAEDHFLADPQDNDQSEPENRQKYRFFVVYLGRPEDLQKYRPG